MLWHWALKLFEIFNYPRIKKLPCWSGRAGMVEETTVCLDQPQLSPHSLLGRYLELLSNAVAKLAQQTASCDNFIMLYWCLRKLKGIKWQFSIMNNWMGMPRQWNGCFLLYLYPVKSHPFHFLLCVGLLSGFLTQRILPSEEHTMISIIRWKTAVCITTILKGQLSFLSCKEHLKQITSIKRIRIGELLSTWCIEKIFR